MKKILMLSANPDDTDRLRWDLEIRAIEQAIALHDKKLECIIKWAVTVDDLPRTLLQYQPNIVHFSGHGAGNHGLVLENANGQKQFVSTQSLAELFKFFKDSIECVFLNACYSEIQAEAIYQHIDYVVGMQKEIGDIAAIKFATGFYQALASNKSYELAYEFGCNAIALSGIPESKTPVLKARQRSPKPEPEKKAPSSQTQNSCSWLRTFNGHSDVVESIAISPDGKLVASGSSDTTIKIWDLNTGNLVYNLTEHSRIVRCIAFSPDGQTLVSSGAGVETTEGSIKLWDVNTGKLKRSLGGGLSGIFGICVAFSPDGKTIASGHQFGGIIKLWDVRSREEIGTLSGNAIDVNSITFSPDGNYLIAACSQGEIKIWDWRNQNLLRTLQHTSNFIGFIVSFVTQGFRCAAISPDGQRIASCGESQAVTIWNFNTGAILHSFTQYKGGVNCVTFSPDGKILASGGEDKFIRICHVSTGKLLDSLQHGGKINCLAFSPDGKTLVSGGDDKTIKVWSLCY